MTGIPDDHARSPAITTACVAVALVAVAFAIACWIGAEPFGSDNDEYRLAAQSLLSTGRASVGDVEATKYPWGYPALLAAFDGSGSPVAESAIALNLMLVVVVVYLTVRTLRRFGILPCAFAGAMIASSGTLWLSAQTVMPDVVLTSVVAAGLFFLTERAPTRRDLLSLTLLATLAVAMKAVGVALALSATGVLLARGARLRALLPLGAGILVLAIPLMLSASLPEHTTGYERTLRLADPYDLSKGELSVTGLAKRSIGRLGSVGSDLGRGLFAPGGDPGVVRIIAAIGLVALGAWVGMKRFPLLLPFVVMYTLVIIAWPYSSSRFGLPYLPVAALGLAALIGRVWSSDRWKLVAIVIGAVLVANAVVVLPSLHVRAQTIATNRTSLADDTRKLQHWMTTHVAGSDDVASFDYRELMLRLERRIRPLPYSSDSTALMMVLDGQGAEWFIASRGIIPERTRYGRSLVRAFAARFQEAYSNDTFDLYRVIGSFRG